MSEKKRKIPVKQHKRKLPSGELTSVKRHSRLIEQKTLQSARKVLKKVKIKPSAEPIYIKKPNNPVPEGFQRRVGRQKRLVAELVSEGALINSMVLTDDFDSKLSEYIVLRRQNFLGSQEKNAEALQVLIKDLNELEASININRITNTIQESSIVYQSNLGIEYLNELPATERRNIISDLDHLIIEERRLRRFITSTESRLRER